MSQPKAKQHPFLEKPNATLIALSFPVLLSLIAEPLLGLIDTAFIAQLGAIPLAALGIGTTALSSVFWIFNFLSIGTQTNVAHALGDGHSEQAAQITSLALLLGLILGTLLAAMVFPAAGAVAELLGAEGDVTADATIYMQIRLLSAPAVLIMLVGFGALRGLQDMRTPLIIAVAVNVLNIVLDIPFIFGFDVAGTNLIPAWGVAGSALASSISQWLGAVWVLVAVGRQLGFSRQFALHDALDLFRIGSDLFMRTGLLTFYLLVATRVANQIGPESGAAHQVIRQVWFFSALVLEAFAVTAQSLVGYFIGAKRIDHARHVATLSTLWSFITGIVLTAAMLISTPLMLQAMVPPSAAAVFVPAWVVASLAQPLNSLAFITDGIHWGTGDYRYLRNAVFVATTGGLIGLALIQPSQPDAFTWVWVATVVWIIIRAMFGMVRIWPGTAASPLRPSSALS